MRVFTDQMGSEVQLAAVPQRIISLVPSQTELLFDLGLDAEVVGITKFCTHPGQWRLSKKIIGGTKKFDLEAIASLQPDLILGNKEENYQEGIEALKEKYPVWMSDIVSFEDALFMIRAIADITDRVPHGNEIIGKIEASFSRLLKVKARRTLYLIWRDPWQGAASGTFIHAMLEKAGFQNVLEGMERYPRLSEEILSSLRPEWVLLSSEPFPFAEKHQQEILRILPEARIFLVDGEMFSWYGSRMARMPDYLSSLNFES